MIYARIAGTGSYLPEKIVTNHDLEKSVATSDEWIRERTGIKKRHVAADGETSSDMGLAAARNAIEMAGVDASEVDLIVVATTTPDKVFPTRSFRATPASSSANSTSTVVQLSTYRPCAQALFTR